jgi:hypothetical protein
MIWEKGQKVILLIELIMIKGILPKTAGGRQKNSKSKIEGFIRIRRMVFDD